MLLYDLWYRRYGLRRASELLTPILKPLSELALPRGSIYFYPGQGVNELGPSGADPLFKDVSRLIFVHHVTDLTRQEGAPRLTTFNFANAIRDYHQTNRRFRRALDIEQGLRDQVVPFVVNLSLLDQRYRYVRSMFSDLNSWRNKFGTTMDTVAEFTVISDRNCFVMIDIPEHLPTLTFLRIACEDNFTALASTASYSDVVTESDMRHEKEVLKNIVGNFITKNKLTPAIEDINLGPNVVLEKMTSAMLKVFNSNESLAMLEVWKWLGDKRSESLLNKIPEDKLNKVTIILKDGSKFIGINLGMLNAWRSDPSKPDSSLLKPAQLQIRFLRLMMGVVDMRNGAPLEDKLDSTLSAKLGENTEVEAKASEDGKQDDMVVTDEDGNQISTSSAIDAATDPLTPIFDTTVDISFDDTQDELIKKEIAELALLMQHVKDATVSEVEGKIFSKVEDGLESGVKAKCDELANFGMISSKDHAKYQDLATAYKGIPIPEAFGYPDGTLADLIVVDPASLVINSKPIPDNPTVLDKSMLQRPLSNFHSKYIKDVLPRNIAGCVLALQNAGICVTDYNVERIENIAGTYDSYSVRVVPVEGAPSTLRFRIPVVEEDGSFVSGNVRYRMRMQRADSPIRKISTRRVALTSYYGKIFISRSEKSVNDYAKWVLNKISAMSLDPNSGVTNAKTGNYFNGEWPVPRGFSILASRFIKLDVKGYTIYTDYSKRAMLYGKAALARADKQRLTILGKNQHEKYLVMDSKSVIYETDFVTPDLNPIGCIEELFNIGTKSAPMDFAEIQLFSKTIPLGIALGYMLGLDTLLRVLKVKPKRYNLGESYTLGADEYAITFNDEIMVLNRFDQQAALILGGFSEYDKVVRNFSVKDFDKPHVYAKILESNSLSVRYLKELTLLNNMFVDPITLSLLKGMNEPVNFKGLLFRAAELLITDQHKHEMDGAEMRLRGYERFAGAVYSELVKSVRAQSGGIARSKSPIDLNPFAVSKAISQDASMQLVNEINPIEDLKMTEAVTYTGTGGRSKRSMNKQTRRYHKNDMGVISEATVDSSDVGINIFTSANPQLVDLYGQTKPLKPEELQPSSLLSTPALLSPGSDRDDQLWSD